MIPEILNRNNQKGYDALLHGSSKNPWVRQRLYKYTIQEKMSILKEYESGLGGLGVRGGGWKRSVADKYKLNPSQLNKWTSTRNNLLRLNQLKSTGLLRQNPKLVNVSKKSLCPGKPVRYPNIEKWLYCKFEEYREKHLPVSTRLLAVTSMARYPLIFKDGDQTNRFKRVFDWIYRFRERYGITIRRKTHNAIQDEQEIGRVRVEFVNYFHQVQ